MPCLCIPDLIHFIRNLLCQEGTIGTTVPSPPRPQVAFWGKPQAMVLQPCEGGEKENGSPSRYQLPDSLRKVLAASLSFLSRTVGGSRARVAWLKYYIQAVVFREAQGEGLWSDNGFLIIGWRSLALGLSSLQGTGAAVYKPVPSVLGRHPTLVWENPGHLISRRTSAKQLPLYWRFFKQFTHPGYLEAFKEWRRRKI